MECQKVKLDTSFLHLPLIPTEFTKNTEPKICQFHCWAARKEEQGSNKPAGCRKEVVCYKHCNVHLCIPWFSIFHEVEDLQSSTSTILSNLWM
eukprot:13867709-Ditylum_brightwellii.AAC.1